MNENFVKSNEMPRSYPATAHLPGAVDGRTCDECDNLDPCSNKKRGRCIAHFEMRGLSYRFDRNEAGEREDGWWRGLRAIDRNTPACKYFKMAVKND